MNYAAPVREPDARLKPETLQALRQARRARSTRRFLVALGALCIANFFSFAVGSLYVYAHGERVTPIHADDPNVLMQKGTYYRVSPGMYLYAKIHERVTLILLLPLLPLLFLRTVGRKWPNEPAGTFKGAR